MNRAVLYLRSSKDRHDVSLDAQRRALHELAAARNLVVVGEYCDEVESAKDEDRPGFQLLFKDLRSRDRAWTHVLMLDTGRLARRMETAIWFEEREALPRGVSVVYKSLPDMDPVYRQLFKRNLQSMDEFHSLISKQKGLAGMRENVLQGWRAGGRAPFGYRLAHNETGKTRDQVPVTKSRLEPSIDAPRIAAYLRDRAAGIPRLRARTAAGLTLRDTTLIGIERNALTYAGHTVWNVHNEYASKKGYARGVKRRPRADWVIKKDTHPALITNDEAEQLLAIIEKRAAGRVRTGKRTYLLSGLLRAPDGQPWHGDAGNYRLGKGKKIEATRLERAIVAQLAADLVDDAVVKDLTARIRRLYDADEDTSEVRTITVKIGELSRNIEKLSGLLAQTTAPEALLRSIEKWESERTALIDRKLTLESRQGAARRLRGTREGAVRKLLQSMATDLSEAAPDELRDVLRGFLEGVELDPATYGCTMRYQIDPLRRGDKLASPRTFEPIPPIKFERKVWVEPRLTWKQLAA